MPTVHPVAMPLVMRRRVLRTLAVVSLVALLQPAKLPVATVGMGNRVAASREVANPVAAMHQSATVLRVRALDASTAADRGRTAASVRTAMDEAVEAAVNVGGDAAASRVIGHRAVNAPIAGNARTAAIAAITSLAMQARQSFWS